MSGNEGSDKGTNKVARSDDEGIFGGEESIEDKEKKRDLLQKLPLSHTKRKEGTRWQLLLFLNREPLGLVREGIGVVSGIMVSAGDVCAHFCALQLMKSVHFRREREREIERGRKKDRGREREGGRE